MPGLASGVDPLNWRLDGITEEGSKLRATYLEGALDLAPLRAMRSAFPEAMAALDDMQAKPDAKCRSL